MRVSIPRGAVADRAESAECITQLLVQWQGGRPEALEELMDRVYPELERIASAHFRRERSSHTLEPSALVHEAYLRLLGQTRTEWQNRAHFFALASTLMRRILVDHARARGRAKRKGLHVTLHEDDAVAPGLDVGVLALDDALEKLHAEGYELEGRVIQLRFFAGLTIEETAQVVNLSPRSVKRAWTFARSWLFRELRRSSA